MARAPQGRRFAATFHDARPGLTSAALAQTDSYARLAAAVAGHRILDLGCGDHPLPAAIGVDLSRSECAAARARGARVVRADAAALPFAGGSFDAAVAHFSFMLFDQPEAVVAELARVLVPGGTFAATLGGGPTADGRDAFHAFLAILGDRIASPPLGDPRSRSERGWRELFAGWDVRPFARHVLALPDFASAWRYLGTTYELAPADAPAVETELRAWWDAHPDAGCAIATFIAIAISPI